MARHNTVFKEAYNRCLAGLNAEDSLPSEPELGERLGISRTTVRAILGRMHDSGLINWDKRVKTVLRPPKETKRPIRSTTSSRKASCAAS